MYQVVCECTKTHTVSLADAGATLACGCGRKVEVPPLHQLRILAGENVLSPAVKIRTLLLDNQLPGTQECVCCGRKTGNLAKVEIKYEWAILKSGVTGGEKIAGCLLFGVLGSVLWFQNRKPIEHGSDQAVVVPIRVCVECRHKLESMDVLKEWLRKTPEYAELLDQYPNSRITLQR